MTSEHSPSSAGCARSAMRLRSLGLHGFKSFAARTQIDFEPGITAVVGPNGSGKSNVADAFRWVLGEQSMRTLRGKRTEDVVFAGGASRAPAGLAEVELTIDHLGPPLDLPFTELSIVRRAYRSGESEFYLNRDRVRLRDVTDLVGRLGLGTQGLAVVGQGAVDAALSLRPEDRRTLLEHAAAVGHLHARLNEALERLASTEQNLARVSDLLAEITPRLRSLERQARQVREREAIQIEYDHALLRWYGNRFVAPRDEQVSATREGECATRLLAESRRGREVQASEVQDARAALEALRDDVVRLTTALNQIGANTTSIDARINQTRDLQIKLHERDAELERRGGRNEAEQIALNDARRRATEERAEIATRIAQVDAALAEAVTEAAEVDRVRRERETELGRARDSVGRAQAELIAIDARLRSVSPHLRQLEEARPRRLDEVTALVAQVAQLHDSVERARETRDAARWADEDARRIRQQATESLGEARTRHAEGAGGLAQFDRAVHSARARVEALQAMDESGAGLYPGVRAVLQASNGHGTFHLDGIVGIVARLVAARQDQEVAVETALGGHAQDVVVERWKDAEAAIVELKRRGAGRATFLPLDTIRPPRAAAAPVGEGILGVAAELVEVEGRFRPVADFLLGHTLIVADLAVARSVLPRCPPSYQVVTLDGEVARPSGAVTGGSGGPAKSGALGRARELREARRLLAARVAERERLAEQVTAIQRQVDQAQEAYEDATRRQRLADDTARAASGRLADLERDLERARRGLDRLQTEVKRDDVAETGLQKTVTDLAAAKVAAERVRAEAEERATRARDALATFETSIADKLGNLAALRAERAQGTKRLNALDAEIDHATKRLQAALAEHSAIEEQRRQQVAAAAELTRRADALRIERAEVNARRDDLARQLDQRRGDVSAAEERLTRVLDEQRRQEEAERVARATLQRIEARLERAQVELDALSRQLELELGPVDRRGLVDGVLRVNHDGRMIEVAVRADEDVRRLENRLETMRGRLRALPSGAEIVAEYDSARQRHAFLSDQAADLSQAVATLRQTIDETRSTMRSRFAGTFDVVNEAFGRHFSAMFGGGSARLVLDGGDEEPGVEVTAQPPGKRAQNLATLSGGERALTAAALLFALVEVNPPPFCVLDEVDAALDESNVGRFAHTLRELSARTQFVVITHNRRTMEVASAIFGLTLENRSESRVLSLKLPGM